MTSRVGRLAAVVAALALALTFVPGTAAWAHGPEDTERAYDLVRQAIALIVSTPDDMDGIADKVNDAMEADDASGVQITLVKQAEQAMEAGDLHQTRALLEKSIGARVHTDASEPVPIGQPAPVGADTGTVAAVDPLPGRDGVAGSDWIMLALSLLVGLGGIALSLQLRPRHLPHPGPSSGR
jgi:hypothetical protein